MDVNDHERLSNITQNLGKEQYFNGSSSFHSHRRVFNNEHISYQTMSVKLPLVSIREVLITSIGKLYIWAALLFGFYLVMKLHFADGCAVINTKPLRGK
jgi:type IV secretory pathway TraG/TraD family ATPase VirD4